MKWNSITALEDVQRLIELSNSKPQVIFKHSISCPISGMAKMRVEDNVEEVMSDVDFHYLDLIRHRTVSNFIAEELEVFHESPQIILLVDGEVKYDASHFDISVEELNEALNYHFANQ